MTDNTTIDASIIGLPEACYRVTLLIHDRAGVRAASLTPGEPLTLGRTAPADVVIPDSALSRQHARFRFVENVVWLEDLSSRNGTWVNGQRLDKPSVIAPGDEVALGRLRVTLHVSGGLPSISGLVDHERFRFLLEHEVQRVGAFGGRLALLMVEERGADSPRELARWSERVAEQHLRPAERIGLYASVIAELLLPQATVERARTLAETAGEEGLLCGVAHFPDAAASSEELFEVCRAALRRASPRRPVELAPSNQHRVAPMPGEGPDALIVAGSAMQQILLAVERVAQTTIPVLIEGETGSGKELVARAIHERSSRAACPLIAVNCGSIPESLVTSTLFGHQRGAFTGADRAAEGVFRAAEGGSIFLDEIGELSMSAQVALLRALETKSITPVGSTAEVSVDVRIITATHRDLEKMCAQEAFRWDLYYRLNAMVIEVPPLRERQDEIVPLAHRFLRQAAEAGDGQLQVTDIDLVARRALEAYGWPGNVRELRNAIHRAVAIANTPVITIEELPERVRAGQPSPQRETGRSEREAVADLAEQVRSFEVALLTGALRQTKGNQTEAASLLGLPRRTLVHKLGSYEIDRQRWITDVDEDAPPLTLLDDSGRPLCFTERVARHEARLISEALQRAGGSRAEAARQLGISVYALSRRLRKHGL